MRRRKFSREFKIEAVKLIRERVCRWSKLAATGRAMIDKERSLSIEVWAASLDDDSWDERVLSEDERERADRFILERDRSRFVAARSFMRQCLADQVGIDPAALRFCYTVYGRPQLEVPDAPTFSLSHSEGFALLAISQRGPVGADLELIRPMPDLLSVASEVMHADEMQTLVCLNAQDRLDSFYTFWTRKEAVLKAMGGGLSGNTRLINIGLVGQRCIRVDEIECQVQSLHSIKGFAAALCVSSSTPVLDQCTWRSP